MLQNAPKSTAEKALRGTSDKDARFPQQRSKKNKRLDSAKKKKKKHQVRTQLRRENPSKKGRVIRLTQALPINISDRDTTSHDDCYSVCIFLLRNNNEI